MKNFNYIMLLLLFSCSIQKNKTQSVLDNTMSSKEKNLTIVENNIINNFIDSELEKEIYKPYKDYELFVIEEALQKTKSLYAYEHSYNEFFKQNKERDFWLLDSLQIKKKKEEIEFEKQYYWKVSDFKNIKVKIQKYEDFIQATKTDGVVYLSKRIVIFFSKPLMINDSNALLAYDCVYNQGIYHSMTHFTVLMKKVDEKWIQYEFFEDGIF